MKKLPKIALLVLIVWALLRQNLYAQTAWIDSVTAWTINGYFTRAESFLNQKISQTDSALTPCFYLSSVLNSKMTHYENTNEAPKFEALLHYVIQKSEQKLQDPELSDSLKARLLFFKGSAYGYLAFFQGQTGRWLKALENGLKAIKNLNRCLEFDSTLYEAYLGLGTYKYWRSTKLKAILWLPFVSDLRDEGIADIKRSLHSRALSRYMAMHQLIYILIDYQRYNEALDYAKQAVQKFPKSPFMWWAYAHVFFKSHDYPKALKAYQHLLQLIEHHPEANPSHWLDCQVRIAELYKRMGQPAKARKTARLILQKQHDFPNTEKNRQRLKHARDLLDN